MLQFIRTLEVEGVEGRNVRSIGVYPNKIRIRLLGMSWAI